VTAHRHMKKQLTLSELSATINAEEHERASSRPSLQVHVNNVEKGRGGKS
jgi:hypothetical protein